ncbi:alpha/beta fold hydrolase [Emticicia sp. SJ17W-69]|uniref:alpha/beta fold hydrolase n=1 Tax=Emticicia sp. SJ17W-69 TaxID=3421657 RepID=UPI003EB7E1A9
MRKLFCLLFLSHIAFAQSEREPLFTSFDGTKIHYDIKGEGFPVVLVHGFMSNSNSWKRGALIPALVKEGFTVITLDLRGNGLSDKPHSLEAYENNAEIKDVMALMKHLGFKKYDVVGYSRGAILTARQLILDKHLHKTVIGGVGADFTDPNWERRKMFAEAFSGKAHLYPETKGAIESAKRNGVDTLVMGFLQKVQPATTPAQLAKVRKPVLVIAGDQDLDNGNSAELAKLLPKSTLKTVPGNHGNTSQSEAFAKEVVLFLKEK